MNKRFKLYVLTLLLSLSVIVSGSLIGDQQCYNGGVSFNGKCICPSFVSGSQCENAEQCKSNVGSGFEVINPWDSNDVFHDDKNFVGCDVHPDIMCCWQNISNTQQYASPPANNAEKLKRLLNIYGPWSEMDKKMLQALELYWGDVDSVVDSSSEVLSPVDPTPKGQQVRLAFVLMVHANYEEHLPLLMEAIYHPHHYYIIHVDASTDADHYNWLVRFVESFLARKTLEITTATGARSEIPYNNIRFVQQRIRGAWGSISLVYQNMVTLSELLKWTESETTSTSTSTISTQPWQHVIMLSAYDMPVKRISQLEEYLRYRRDSNFISVSSNTRLDRCENTYQSCYGSMKQMSFNTDVCPFERYPNRFYNEERYTYREGSQWTILSLEFCQHLLKTFDGIEVLMAMKFNLIPDEGFFQTAIGSSPFKKFHDWNALRMLPWKNGVTHPVVTMEHLDQISSTDYFTRKVEDIHVAKAIFHRFIDPNSSSCEEF